MRLALVLALLAQPALAETEITDMEGNWTFGAETDHVNNVSQVFISGIPTALEDYEPSDPVFVLACEFLVIDSKETRVVNALSYRFAGQDKPTTEKNIDRKILGRFYWGMYSKGTWTDDLAKDFFKPFLTEERLHMRFEYEDGSTKDASFDLAGFEKLYPKLQKECASQPS